MKKIAFFCSRKCPADLILKSYDWALSRKGKSEPIISGFHTPIEKDVLHFLIKNEVPVIVAIARGMYKLVPKEFKEPLEKGNLLIISNFGKDQKRMTAELAIKRNEYVMDMADEVVVGYADPVGALYNILSSANFFNYNNIHFLQY